MYKDSKVKRVLKRTLKIIIFASVFVLVGVMSGKYLINQYQEKQELELLAENLKKQNSEIKIKAKQSKEEIKKEMISEMLDRLAQYEGKNDKLDKAGELNYANDPIKNHFPACRQIGGWRKSECDTWTKYRWQIATAQHFYKKEYGKSITEKEMLKLLLDDEWVDNFTAQVIINNKGAIWHWHGASATEGRKEYFRAIIKYIRKL